MAVSRLHLEVFKKPPGAVEDPWSSLGTSRVLLWLEMLQRLMGPGKLLRCQWPLSRLSSQGTVQVHKVGAEGHWGTSHQGQGDARLPSAALEEVVSGSSGRLTAVGDRDPHLLTQPGI